jgi:hypothetical protein
VTWPPTLGVGLGLSDAVVPYGRAQRHGRGLVGGWVSHSAGRPAVRGAGRQLLIVVAAAAVTYGIGKLFGTTVT